MSDKHASLAWPLNTTPSGNSDTTNPHHPPGKEICRRYNDSHCRYMYIQCHYHHVCSECGSHGIGAPRIPARKESLVREGLGPTQRDVSGPHVRYQCSVGVFLLSLKSLIICTFVLIYVTLTQILHSLSVTACAS